MCKIIIFQDLLEKCRYVHKSHSYPGKTHDYQLVLVVFSGLARVVLLRNVILTKVIRMIVEIIIFHNLLEIFAHSSGSLGGLFGASRGSLGGLLGASGGLLGASGCLLGASWGSLGRLLGVPWGSLAYIQACMHTYIRTYIDTDGEVAVE